MAATADAVVLCYHAVSPTWTAPLSTTPDRLAHQVSGLLDRGYAPMRFSELVEGADRGRRLAVTFDDAYRSVIELALPILRSLGAPATVFAPTGYIGRETPMSWPGIDEWLTTPSRDELLPMSWDELRTLHAAGWEVGSHTVSHPHLTTIDDSMLSDELRRSREDCERELGVACASIAYPYGDVDARVVRAAQAAGYTTGALLSSQLTAARPLEWPRIGVYRVDDARRFALKVSPAMRALRGSALWDVTQGVRDRLARG